MALHWFCSQNSSLLLSGADSDSSSVSAYPVGSGWICVDQVRRPAAGLDPSLSGRHCPLEFWGWETTLITPSLVTMFKLIGFPNRFLLMESVLSLSGVSLQPQHSTSCSSLFRT